MIRSRIPSCVVSVLIVAASLLAAGGGCSDGQSPPDSSGFPTSFLWGTAIAGFQVDMGCPHLSRDECDDRRSDWYEWVMSPRLRRMPFTYLAGQDVSAGPGYWELYDADHQRARDVLANNALRLSIEWSRIFPTTTVGKEGYEALLAVADRTAIAHYHSLFQSMRARGLKPLVTLNHYTIPLWMHEAERCHFDPFGCSRGGWIQPDRFVHEIAKYAGFVAREFGAEVDLWATLNEHTAVLIAGFIYPSGERTNPPGIFGPIYDLDKTIRILFTMIDAHARMYDEVHANDTRDADGDGKAAEVGPVMALNSFQPKNPDSALDVKAAEHAFYVYGTVFLNAVVYGDVDRNLDGIAEEHRPDLEGRTDFVGINYYTKVPMIGLPFHLGSYKYLDFLPDVTALYTSYPHGIYEMAEVVRGYGVPSYITENGVNDPLGDETGPKFLIPHLLELRQAIEDGADVRGYFYWSLMDNYEWNHGLTTIRMGMFGVDPNDPEKERTAKLNAGVYGRISECNCLPRDLIDRYAQ